ncbi:hypothetical protein TcCL_Unassigned06096, partial [Trypanosoma cruzi]
MDEDGGTLLFSWHSVTFSCESVCGDLLCVNAGAFIQGRVYAGAEHRHASAVCRRPHCGPLCVDGEGTIDILSHSVFGGHYSAEQKLVYVNVGCWMVVARGRLLATGYGGKWLFPAVDESASVPRSVGNVVAVGALGCCCVCGTSGADSRWLYRYSCCAYFMSLNFFGAVAVFRPLISPLDNGYYLLVVLVSVWLLAADIELLLHPDNEPALFAACTAAIVAIVAFFVYIVLKTLQVIAFARRKWAGADVRGAAGTRYREPNQTALFNLPTGGQKQPEMSPSSSSTATPAAGPPLVVPHVQNLVERTVGGDPRD